MTTRLPAFTVLVDMARNDPDGLETLRRSLTNAVIATAASERAKRRLQGLQFRVDLERRRAGTPLAATIRISEMMCHSLRDLHASMVTPFDDQRASNTSHSTTNVLPFPRKRSAPSTGINFATDDLGRANALESPRG